MTEVRSRPSEVPERDRDRRHDDFIFQLNSEELEILKSQIVTSSPKSMGCYDVGMRHVITKSIAAKVHLGTSSVD